MTTATIPLRVAKRIEIASTGECWLWTGAKAGTGYGVTQWRRGERFVVSAVHRIMYEFAHGEIPAGHQVHHTCEVRACVNPAHLVAVTQAEHNEAHGYRVQRLAGQASARKSRERAALRRSSR